MESTRQKKVSRLIQKELSFILQTNVKEIVSNIIVSVTKVNVSSDFSNATIYISIFPVKEPENVLNSFGALHKLEVPAFSMLALQCQLP